MVVLHLVLYFLALQEMSGIVILSYSTVVLYIGFGVFCPKIPPRNLPNIYFLTAWQHWLGIAEPKNVFRWTLNLCIKLLWNFWNFFIWFFYWLTGYLMPSDKHNSITAKAIDLISSLINVTLSRDVPFRQPLQLQCSYHTKLTFVLVSAQTTRVWCHTIEPLGCINYDITFYMITMYV